MGKIIDANCSNCGFKTQFRFGGNMRDFQTYCPVPAINKVTNEFTTVDVKDKYDSKYILYSDKELKGHNLNGATYTNFDLELNENNNYCPNCKKFSLSFWIFMLTD